MSELPSDEVNDQEQGSQMSEHQPYYEHLYKTKLFFGRFGPQICLICGEIVPPRLAKRICAWIYRTFHIELVPVSSNYTWPWQARFRTKLFGTNKDFVRRALEQGRMNLGSQIWFSHNRDAEDGNNCTFIIHDLSNASVIIYDLQKADGEGGVADYVEPSAITLHKGVEGFEFRARDISDKLDDWEEQILEAGYPADGTYHLCLIGWTTQAGQKVTEISHNIMQELEQNFSSSNRCQEFFLRLYEGIRDRQAPRTADYTYFNKSLSIPHQNRAKQFPKLPEASVVIAEMKVRQLQLTQHQPDRTDRALSKRHTKAVTALATEVLKCETTLQRRFIRNLTTVPRLNDFTKT